MNNYGLDLNKIKNNFKQYQTKTDDKVYSGGTRNFNEKTGRYTQPGGVPKYTQPGPPRLPQPGGGPKVTQPGRDLTHPKPGRGSTKPQEFKNNYADNLKKYMNIGGNTTTNTNNSENNNINQNAGNKEDWMTNIGDYNDIKYSNIGNDYSVNIGGIGDGFSNMQGAAAYTALNNNQSYRSSSELNGIKRSAQASEQATGLVGAKDRAANLYNSVGYSQNYWGQKADAQQNFYLGDIYSQQAPNFQLPESPSNPMDGDTTQDTLNDFRKNL